MGFSVFQGFNLIIGVLKVLDDFRKNDGSSCDVCD